MGVDDWKREERLHEAVKWKLGGMGRKLGGEKQTKIRRQWIMCMGCGQIEI